MAYQRLRFMRLGFLGVLFFAVTTAGHCATAESDAVDQYNHADMLMNVGDDAHAIQEWTTLCQNFTDQPRICVNARLAIGKAYHTSGQTNAALNALRDLVRDCKDYHRQSAEALLEIALIYKEQGNLILAIVESRKVTSGFADMTDQCARSRLLVATCLVAQNKPSEALLELSAVTASYPGERAEAAEATMRIGRIQLAANQYDQAISQFASVSGSRKDLDIWPTEALLWTATAQDAAGQSEAALGSYAKLIADYPRCQPECVRARMGRGQIYERLNQPNAAVKEYEAAIKDYSRYTVIGDGADARIAALLPTAGLTAADAATLDQVRTAYRATKSANPMDATDQQIAGLAGTAPDYSAQRNERVQSCFRKAGALIGLKRCGEAIPVLHKILNDYNDLESWSVNAMLRIGKAQRCTGDSAGALETFANLLTSYPSCQSECADAVLYRAQVYENDLADYDSAINEYGNLIRDYGQYLSRVLESHESRARLLRRTQRKAEALSEWDRTVSDFSQTDYGRKSLPMVYVLKGETQIQCGLPAEARDTLKTMLSTYPEYRTPCKKARFLLAQALGYIHAYGELLTLLDEMQKSGDYTSRFEKGTLGIWTATSSFPDYDKAEPILTQVIADGDGDALAKEAYFHRSLVRTYRGQFDKALEDLQHVDTPHLQHYARGLYYFYQKDWQEAAAELELVATTMPQTDGVSTHEACISFGFLEQCYTNMKDEVKAAGAKGRGDAYRASI